METRYALRDWGDVADDVILCSDGDGNRVGVGPNETTITMKEMAMAMKEMAIIVMKDMALPL